MSTAKEQFFRDLEDNYASSIATIRLKNEDYATGEDPFNNFREAAFFAGVPLERAMLVRIGDKFGRFKNILGKEELGQSGETAVADETIEDTLRDILGYVNILAVYRAWKNKVVDGYLFSGTPDDYVTLVPEQPQEESVEYVEEEPQPAEEVAQEPQPEPVDERTESYRQKLRDFLKLS